MYICFRKKAIMDTLDPTKFNCEKIFLRCVYLFGVFNVIHSLNIQYNLTTGYIFVSDMVFSSDYQLLVRSSI